jgi:lysophospholipase L1-like esterase
MMPHGLPRGASLDENNNLDNKYSYDKLHLNEDGYMIVKNALEQHVK